MDKNKRRYKRLLKEVDYIIDITLPIALDRAKTTVDSSILNKELDILLKKMEEISELEVVLKQELLN